MAHIPKLFYAALTLWALAGLLALFCLASVAWWIVCMTWGG